jgi:hypothetical protein
VSPAAAVRRARRHRLPTLRETIADLDLAQTLFELGLTPSQQRAVAQVRDALVAVISDAHESEVYLAAVLRLAVVTFDAVYPNARTGPSKLRHR